MTKREVVLDSIRRMMLSFLVSEGVAVAVGSVPLAVGLSVGTGLYYGRKIDLDIRSHSEFN